MSPSPYPVLNNKPIDQWKVTELKEELKRRRLPLRGLKDELVRRLDDALRQEAELENAIEAEEEEQVETPPIHSGYRDDAEVEEAPPVQQEEEVKEAPLVEQVEEVKDVPVVQQEAIERVEEAPVLLKEEIMEADPKGELENPVDPPEADKIENTDVKMDERDGTETIMEEPKPEAAGVEPVCASNLCDEIRQRDLTGAEELKPGQAKPDEQVSQVGPNTGSQAKCESISSNESSKCINVENELKDNLNADNFDLEKQVEVKHDIQDDKNKEPVKNQANTSSLEVENYENTPSNDTNSIIDADGGSPEKLNLDRSSGDESMEADLTESSKPLVESMGGGAQEEVKEEVNSVIAPGDSDKMDIAAAEEVIPAVATPSEKRKLEAQELVQNNNENFKRQRRWNTESQKVPNLPNSPKDLTPPAPPKRIFNRSDSNISSGSPKERIGKPYLLCLSYFVMLTFHDPAKETSKDV